MASPTNFGPTPPPRLPAPDLWIVGSRAAPRVVVVGGGPAGLMAADLLSGWGARVELFEATPSCGRKFLLAGNVGLNLAHGEPIEPFLDRYAQARGELAPMLHRFGPRQVRARAASLGVSTSVGSSGRVLPSDRRGHCSRCGTCEVCWTRRSARHSSGRPDRALDGSEPWTVQSPGRFRALQRIIEAA